MTDNCVICGEAATKEREGRPVCDFHRSMIDGGYSIAEIEGRTQSASWWLLEMIGGGRFAVISLIRPDTSQVITCSAPPGTIALSIEANSYRIIGGPYNAEQIESLLNPPKEKSHFVTITPRKGMKVRTPNGRGIIDWVGDDYIIVDGEEYKTHECVVLDVMVTSLNQKEEDD